MAGDSINDKFPVAHARLRLASFVALASSVALVVAVALIYTRFAVPVSDEFCRVINRLAPLDFWRELYETKSGRWLAMGIHSFYLSGRDLAAPWYRQSLLVAPLLWGTGFFAAASVVMADRSIRERVAAALLLLAVFWDGIWGRAEVFYWFAAIVENGGGFALGAIAMALAWHGLGRPVLLPLAGIVGILASGMHELAGAFLMIGLSVLLLIQRDKRLLIPICLIALGLLINAVAPGNSVRAASYEHAPPWRLLFVALRPYKSVMAMLGDPRTIALVLCVLALPGKPRAFDWRWPALLVAAAIVLMMALTWLQGFSPANQVLAFFQATLLSLIFGLAWSQRGRLPGSVLAPATFGLALLLITAPNMADALGDLREANGIWRRETEVRWMALAAEPTGRDLVVDRPTMVPAPLQDIELSTDPNNWFNRCAADYFHQKSITGPVKAL